MLITSNVLWENGKFIHTRCLTRDISERKQAEEERVRLLARERAARTDAEAQRGHLQAVLEHIPEGVLIADALGGPFTVWHTAAQGLLGLPLAQVGLAGWRSVPVMYPDGKRYPFEDLPLARVLRSGEPMLGAELAFERPNGSRIVLLVNAALDFQEEGLLGGSVVVFQDLTYRKTVKQLKDEFMSLAAHELKTPVTEIKGHSQLLLRQLGRDGPACGDGLGRAPAGSGRTAQIHHLQACSGTR